LGDKSAPEPQKPESKNMKVIFHYLPHGGDMPEAVTFPDYGIDFEEKPISSIGDCVMLPYIKENGKRSFKATIVLSRRFIVDPYTEHNDTPTPQDEVTMVVTDAPNTPEFAFAD
jgi:hypothetical protein